jgi:hypothetical protein
LKHTDRAAFAAMVAGIHVYYGKVADQFTLDLFWRSCERFELEQISKAIQTHTEDPTHGSYCPKVSDMMRILAGTVTDRSALAWGKVFEAMSQVGAYTDVVFDDPAIHAAIEDCGGWSKICRSKNDELSYLQHRFCGSYKAYAGLGTFPYPRLLMGDRASNAEFAKRGLPPPKAAVVGDREVAKWIYLGGTVGGKASISHDVLAALTAPRNRPLLAAA